MLNRDLFQPHWASAPGETIREVMALRHISPRDLEIHLGVSHQKVRDLLEGNMRITFALAEKLSHTLGSSAQFWVNRDIQYVEDSFRLKAASKEWLRTIPVGDMIRFGWLKACEDAASKYNACLSFFGVSSVNEWRENWLSEQSGLTAFRTSPVFESQAASVATWLRQGEIESEKIHCKPWSASRFNEELENIKPLTRVRDPNIFLPALREICANCGVAVVVVRAPKGCRASGATRFISKEKAILQLSFRYLSDDQFWFTFFHEAGHLILHDKRLFLEIDSEIGVTEEDEANDFAARTLIPPELEAELESLGSNHVRILRFAKKAGIAPGIVVGQLQHKALLPRNRLNSIKRRFSWED